ncbi:MAG: 5'/3'-nucleotidase SurE, partial [Methanoregula sp.]
YVWITGPLLDDAEEGTDVHAVRKGNISVTPITLDCTAYEAKEETRKVFLE